MEQCARGIVAVYFHEKAVLVGNVFYGAGFDFGHIQPLSQALEQCARYLYENFPSAELIPAPSTAASLDMLKTEEDAAIAGSHTVKAGFTLSDNNIADGDGNFTHFLLVKKGDYTARRRKRRGCFAVNPYSAIRRR